MLNRGPDGIGVIDLVMQLEQEASAHGGKVISLIGNHDLFMLAAHRFPYRLRFDWLTIGGQHSDLKNLTPAHISWLENLSAMYRVDEQLLIHADALLYFNYGSNIDQVNQRFRQILRRDDNYQEWIELAEQFSERYAFFRSGHNRHYQLGVEHARSILNQFGGSQIVHGTHTDPCHKGC